MSYLDRNEEDRLNTLRQKNAEAEDALAQVARILESETFLRVRENARNFLQFVVGKKLLGSKEEIKETMIGIRVFGKPADYDPSEDATVRVAAGSLRLKLAQYYRQEGTNDPLEIIIPSDTYVPVIRDRRITIGVQTLENWNPDSGHNHLCLTVTDEILYQLQQHGAVEPKRLIVTDGTIRGCRYIFRGSLLCDGERFRLNVSLSDIEMRESVFADTFEAPREALLKVSREVADGLVRAIRQPGGDHLPRQVHFASRLRKSEPRANTPSSKSNI